MSLTIKRCESGFVDPASGVDVTEYIHAYHALLQHEHHVRIGRRGGSAKSEKKAESSRRNGLLGGRRRADEGNQ